jgi:hypothetical protein
MSRQIDLSLQSLGVVPFSCNTWIEPGALQETPNATARYGFHALLSTSKLIPASQYASKFSPGRRYHSADEFELERLEGLCLGQS